MNVNILVILENYQKIIKLKSLNYGNANIAISSGSSGNTMSEE